jgi:hypothetical protein
MLRHKTDSVFSSYVIDIEPTCRQAGCLMWEIIHLLNTAGAGHPSVHLSYKVFIIVMCVMSFKACI